MTALIETELPPALTTENWLDDLSGQEQRFVLEYLKNYDVLAACRAGGYADSMADSKAYGWVRNGGAKPNVARAVEFGRKMLNDALLLDAYMVLREAKAIATADIRRAVKWRGSHVEETDNDEGGDVLVVKRTVTNLVEFVPSDELPDDIARAVAEVGQDANGNVKLKMHPKVPALQLLAKSLGMLTDTVKHVGPGGGPVQVLHVHAEMSPKQAAEAWQAMLDSQA
jgi:phage terminase small subunit